MNEVTDAHGTATNEDDAVLNALNQLFINTVRATGSNNTKRWLAITGRFGKQQLLLQQCRRTHWQIAVILEQQD